MAQIKNEIIGIDDLPDYSEMKETRRKRTMVESQSRYSIVERLTTNKLEIMDEIGQLDFDILNKKQNLSNAEKDLDQWKSDVEEDQKRIQRQKERDIEKIKSSISIAEERKKQKEATLKEKITELDKALDAIQEISKSAPTPQEQA